ncbi:DUF4132 domain-containing protein [Actinomadura macra]|uniref:DUF4132 domain-containing protein n=1 Tax=Actinomadura macra TaxID=46164 RepID=UPI0008360EC8
MSAEREWDFADWCRHYRDHPVTGHIAQALIWEFEDADGHRHAATPGGRALPVPPLVFSEAVRDVELLVGTASIATDPRWPGGVRAAAPDATALLAEAAFGALTAPAGVSRAARARAPAGPPGTATRRPAV